MKGFIFGAILVGVSASAMARPELNAFINKPANTSPELIAQIKADKAVADRYMRHFSMSRAEVLEYVSGLRLGTIEKSGYYTVYSVPENGVLKAHVSFFKKGTPAFVDSEGNAILRVKCGNPYVRGPVKAYASAPIGTSISDDAANFVSTPVETLAASAPVSTASNFTFEPVPEIVTQTIPSEGPLTLKSTPMAPTSTGAQGFAPIGIISAIGGAFAFTNRSSGPPPVPEPASMIAMGLGIAGLLAKKRKK